MELCADYQKHFIVHGRDVGEHARHYLTGLLGRNIRKSIGRIEEALPDSNYQGLQQFISDSPWDEQALLRQVRAEAEAVLGRHRDTALYLDETSFVKKGAASVGVQRQYCGRLGKLDNCQVGVFACLGRGERTTLVDFRLFLPESWAQDPVRCQKAKVPETERRHQTKAQLALAMVRQARAEGLSYRWVGGDEIYGNNRPLTDALDDAGEIFLMDIASTHQLWDRDPGGAVPASTKRKGRPRTQRVVTAGQVVKKSAAQWVTANFAEASRELFLRSSTKGPLRAKIWVKEVWQWEPADPQARRRLLVVRQERDGTFKYSLSNAAADTAWERLAYMQTQRFWIERAFQDAKSELGMADYEVRGWKGWHHHMALVCLALVFTVKERIAQAESLPLLSVRDIVELLEIHLPRRPQTPAAVLAAMSRRHRARQKSIEFARKKHKQTKVILTK
jgi:SRSO17 transposase